MNHPRRYQAGFTLVEALSTTVLAALVLGLGIPALQGLWARNALVTEVNGFVTALHHARSSALTRGAKAILCPSPDGRTCVGGGDWSQGYLLFVDLDQDRHPGPKDLFLWYNDSAKAHQVRIHSSLHRPKVVYRYDGSSPGTNLTLTFCALSGATPPRAVILNNSGRPRLARRKPGGEPLACD